MNEIFVNAGYFLLFINCLICLKSFSKNGKAFRIFTYYSFTMFAIQMAAHYMSSLGMNNLFLSHFYFIVQFILLSLFYIKILHDKFQKKVISINLFLCLALLMIHYALDWSRFYRFNTFETFILSLPLIVYATFHLYNMLNQEKEYYYTTIGILIYLFGSTVVFLTANLLITFRSGWSFQAIFSLNIYLYVVYQLLITYDLRDNLLSKKVSS